MHVADWRVDQPTSRWSRSPLRIWTAWFCPCGLRTVPQMQIQMGGVGFGSSCPSIYSLPAIVESFWVDATSYTFIWRRIRWDYRLHGPVTRSHNWFVLSIENFLARREFNGQFLARLAKSWSDLRQATAAAERWQARATQCCAGRLGQSHRKRLQGPIGKDFTKASRGYFFVLLIFCDSFDAVQWHRSWCSFTHVQDVLELAARVAKLETLAPNLQQHDQVRTALHA